MSNKHSMEDCWVIEFDDESNLDEQTNTVVWDSNLMLDLNQTNGNAKTITHTAEKTIKSFVLFASGQNLTSDPNDEFVTFDVSVDDWVSKEEDVALGSLITVPVSKQGKQIVIRINFNSLTTKIKAVGLHYKY